MIVTAISEGLTGLALLIVPSLVFQILLGVESVSAEGLVVGRIAGAALVAIGVVCWFAQNELAGRAQMGVLTGVLVYDVSAAGLLGYAALSVGLQGIALWPAVALHLALGIWCLGCLFKIKTAGKER